jgi:hypothetical protein
MGKPYSENLRKRVVAAVVSGGLDVYRTVIKKWLKLAIDELDKDQARVPTVDILEQLCYRAKWEKYVDVMMSTNTVMKRYESDREKVELVAWMFGDSLESVRDHAVF